ncbi:protein translocase subunit SecD [Enemella sp. A6]|uniref:protein translocase subunit SecD n=1 Tax=Enemella sp. A6 TaxID=3440152 RepID=UPI003EB7AEF5
MVLGVLLIAMLATMVAMGSWKPKLGLDLQGGTTVTLTASTRTGEVTPESLEQARTIIQNRVDALGVGETEVTTSGGNQIVVAVPNVQQDELVRMVGTTAVLTFRQVITAQPVMPTPPSPSEQPSGEPSGQPSGDPSGQPSSDPTAQPSGEPSGQPSGDPTTAPPEREPQLPQAPRPTEPGSGWSPEEALTWQPSAEDQRAFMEWNCSDPFPEVSDQPLFACNREGTEKYLLGPALISGDQLDSASAGVPQNEFEWVVELAFNGEGARLFEAATRQLAQLGQPNNRFAIVLDSDVISAPSVDEPIPGGRAVIRGGFNQSGANELANVLKYGSLPLTFEVSSVDNISAALGGEQLRAGIIAGIIGLILVLGFAIYIYRALSVVIFASLVMALVMTWAALSILGESVGMALNLPGIAGAIVGIGMTADSFIIYFERVKDEIRQGRTVRSAVESAWDRTKPTLLISNGVQALSAVILFILAIGAVKGFAFVLGLSTVIDLVLIFLFSKPLMTLLARTRFFGEGRRGSGVSPALVGVSELPGSRRRVRSNKEVKADA